MQNAECPDGWIFIPAETGAQNGKGKCVNFWLSGSAHKPWFEAKQYCDAIGARMLLIQTDQEQKFISKVSMHDFMLSNSIDHYSISVNGKGLVLLECGYEIQIYQAHILSQTKIVNGILS